MNICKKALEFFHLLYLRPPRHFHLSPPPQAPPLPPPPSSSLCRTELVPPSPSSRALLHTRTRARPRAPRGLGPASPPPRPRSRSRRPRRGSEQIRAAGEDLWILAPLLTCARRRRPEPAAAPRSSRRRGQEPVAVRCSRLAPPPRPRAPRAAADRSPRGLKLLAPPWTQARRCVPP